MKRKAVGTIYSKFDQLIKEKAQHNGMSYRQAKKFVNEIVSSIAQTVKDGETVTIPGLGSISCQQLILFKSND